MENESFSGPPSMKSLDAVESFYINPRLSSFHLHESIFLMVIQ